MSSAQASIIYAVNGDGQLLWYQHTGAEDGTDAWRTTLEPNGYLGTGWGFRHLFSGGGGVLYAVDRNGLLLWYLDRGYLDGVINWTNMPSGGKGHIGEGWNMKHVFSAGNGIIYAVNPENQLLWYRHLGHTDGTDAWQTTPDPKGYIGEGWDMKHVFCGDDGVIYAVNQQDQLLWYRHLGQQTGTDLWETTPEPKGYIGEGWGMKHVFWGGNGVIYAVNENNQMLWYRHLGTADGTDSWLTSPDPKGYIGEGWDMKHVFGGGWAPRNIGLNLQYQQTSEWCWIAVGAAVDNYYNPASPVTQCGLMTVIGHVKNGYPVDTDAWPTEVALAEHPGLMDAVKRPYLISALTLLDKPDLLIDSRYRKSGGVGDALGLHWVGEKYQASITLAQLTQEIDHGRPVVFDIAWPNGGTHFVTVAGIRGDLLLICDPSSGSLVIPFADFPVRYQGGASQNGVALTQPAASVIDGVLGWQRTPKLVLSG